MEARLNWLIFGAGAIGTYIGASLILSGQRVVFIEQPETASYLLEHGLKLVISGQVHRILHPETVSDIPQALRKAPFDMAIFALKSYSTQSALEDIYPYSDQLPPILCIQNGVENEALIQKVMGEGKVLSGTVTSSVSRRGAGDVVLEMTRGIGIATGHPLSTTIVNLFNKARLNGRLISSEPAMKWSKMLTNLLANASSAILDMPPRQILNHTGLYRVETHQLREAISVMRAHHIPIIDLPGTPVRLFAWMVDNLQPRVSQILLSRIAGQGRGQKMPSFHIDLYSGRKNSEVDFLNGAVVRFGSQVDVQTPVNRWLTQTLMDLTNGKLPLGMYSHQPDKYVRDIYNKS